MFLVWVRRFHDVARNRCLHTMQVEYSIDSDGCLVRKTTVSQAGPHVDPKTDKVVTEAQSPGKEALEQLVAYQTVPTNQIAGDLADIAAKISSANLSKTKGEIAAEEAAAYAASQTAEGAEDY